MPIRLLRTQDGKQFFFQVTAKNGKIIDPSEPLKNKSDLHKGINALRDQLNKNPLTILDETGPVQEKKPRKKKEKVLPDTNIVVPDENTSPDK